MVKDLFTWKFAQCAANVPSYLKVMSDVHRLGAPGEDVAEVQLRKPFPCRFRFRRNTSDIVVVREVFVDQTYSVDLPRSPVTILDFGANIGLASLYFACKYPGATIHAFEPVPDNVAILEAQCLINHLNNIHIHPYGLGCRNQSLTFSMGKKGRYGDLRQARDGERRAASFEVQVRNVQTVLSELGISTIDLLKIDVEGAEHDIFGALESRFPSIRCIVGELHAVDGDMDRLWSLVDRLRTTHLVDVEKVFGNNCALIRAWSRDWIREVMPGWKAVRQGFQ